MLTESNRGGGGEGGPWESSRVWAGPREPRISLPSGHVMTWSVGGGKGGGKGGRGECSAALECPCVCQLEDPGLQGGERGVGILFASKVTNSCVVPLQSLLRKHDDKWEAAYFGELPYSETLDKFVSRPS